VKQFETTNPMQFVLAILENCTFQLNFHFNFPGNHCSMVNLVIAMPTLVTIGKDSSGLDDVLKFDKVKLNSLLE